MGSSLEKLRAEKSGKFRQQGAVLQEPPNADETDPVDLTEAMPMPKNIAL